MAEAMPPVVEEKKEEPLKAEISLKQMKLIRGEENFTVPREYFRAVYDAMMEAIKLKEGEVREVLLQKKVSGQPSPGTPVESREWVRQIIPW